MSPVLPDHLVINASDRELLRNVLNETLNGFAIHDLETTIGMSRSELEKVLEYFDDPSGDAQLQLTLAQARAVLNALRETLHELGNEEFHTRTGFDFAEGESMLGRLGRQLHGS